MRITGIKDRFTPIIKYGYGLRIHYDFQPDYEIDEEGNKKESILGSWDIHYFDHIIPINEIQDFILGKINAEVDKAIREDFRYKDMLVWLSLENQFNYKSEYDLMVQTSGQNLPLTFKFGTIDNPIYYKFETQEEYADFYMQVNQHIKKCVEAGWVKKQRINWEDYDLVKAEAKRAAERERLAKLRAEAEAKAKQEEEAAAKKKSKKK